MIDYFKINDPFRFLVIILITLLIRLPFYIWGDPGSGEEMKWFMLGEKIINGEWLYADIFTNSAPLEAFMYAFIFLLFGKSIAALHIISFLLVCFQCLLFNQLINTHKIHEIATYIPALVYALLSSITPDLYTLHPIIVGNTFILLALNYIFSHIEMRVKKDEKIILIGIYTSMAALFFSGFQFFIPGTVILLVIYTNTVFRRYLLYLYGLTLPILGVYFLFLFKNEGGALMLYFSDFQWVYFEANFIWTRSMYFFLIFLLLSFFIIFLKGKFTNYQNTLNFYSAIWLMLTTFIWFYYNNSFSGIHAIFIPVSAFFIVHFFYFLKSGFWSNLYFTIFISTLIVANIYYWKWDLPNASSLPQYAVHRVVHNPFGEVVSGKRVWSLQEEKSHYIGAKHASPWFDIPYEKPDFQTVDYGSLSKINDVLQNYNPEIIIDKNHELEKFIERIPKFKSQFIYQEEQGVWIRYN